jgi:uncharacterized protein
MECRVRDPVHNFITLREAEVRLVGTRAIQRLRGIRQLAMANLVYPGALHTRFDHTLGVTHVAGLLANALHLDQDDTELVRFAALLHDIGHGPFSHVSEHALERYADRSSLSAGQKKEKIHEIVTAHMIENDEQIIRILGKEKCHRVAKLLGTGHGQPALKSIVSGPLDADKQDYLLRDSRFCGVQYGVFDIHQLHRSLVLFGPDDEKQLMIDPDGIHAVEQYVLAKYYLTTNVYRHRVRLITDQMIVRAITLGIEKDNNQDLIQLYSFQNSDEFVGDYAKWDDARFLHEFCVAASDSRCKAMLDRLRHRRLLKRVFESRIRELRSEVRDLVMGLAKRTSDEVRYRIELDISEILKEITKQDIDPDFVIVYPFDIKSVRETSRNDEEGILVARTPAPLAFTEESMLFQSISEGYVDRIIEVYAPVDWETPADRKRTLRECRDRVRSSIEERCLEATKGAAA